MLSTTLAILVAVQPPPPIRYALGYAAAGDSTVAVAITLPAPIARAVEFGMPRAIPMGYGTQPYDRFVTGLEARDPSDRPIPIDDIEGPRWRIAGSTERPVASIRYRVDLARMERQILTAGDASRARPRYLGLLGYSVFGFIEGLEGAPVQLTVLMPASWPVVTTLAPGAWSTASTRVQAADFYALADAQIMAGPAVGFTQVDAGVPLTVAVYAEEPVDRSSLVELSGRALRAAIDWFGAPPAAHFTTSFEILRPISPDHGYRFSMEHLESATFRFATGEVDLTAAGRIRFQYNILHHVAHAWIPKRCAPAGYYPFEWDYPEPIDAIWFSEGWAQYVAADMLATMERDSSARRRIVGRRFDAAAADSAAPIAGRSLEELSRTASHQYSDDFRIAQTVFSRGGLLAEAIDDRIRERSRGRRSLRNVIRALMSWCGKAESTVTRPVLERIIREAGGVESPDLFDHWLAPRGTIVPGRPRPEKRR